MTRLSPLASVAALDLPASAPHLAPRSEALSAAMRALTVARPAEAGPLDLSHVRRHEAVERLHAVTAALGQRASADTIALWVLHVVVAIGHPTDATEIFAKQRVLLHPLDQLPAACITRRSAAKVAIEAGNWFPPLALIMRNLRAEADDLRREAVALAAILRAMDGPPPRPPSATPEERAAMAAKARQVAAELARGGAASNSATAVRSVMRPAPLARLATMKRSDEDGP